MDLNDIIEALEARPIEWVDRAADQDGWDGGFVASDESGWAWGETVEEARLGLPAAKRGLVLVLNHNSGAMRDDSDKLTIKV
jgi:hypothetical protein